MSLPKPQHTATVKAFLAYNFKEGNYGETHLDDLNVTVRGSFKGNIWAGDGKTKVDLALFFDEKANEQQREALSMILVEGPVVSWLSLLLCWRSSGY